MRADLHLDTVQVGWLVGGYSLPSLLVTLPLGLVADLWGSKRVLVGCLLLFGVSGLGTVTAADFGHLLFWRILQGIAFAPFATLTISMAAEALPREELARAQSYRTVVASFAEFVLPVAAGWLLVLAGGWRPAFYLFALPLAIAAWAVFALPAAEGRAASQRSGLRAQAVRDLRRPDVLGVMMGGFARWFVKYGVYAYLPLYLAYNVHARPQEIGLVVGIPGLIGAIAASQAGRFGLARGGRVALAASLAVFGLSIPAITLVATVWWAAACSVVLGVADGFMGPLLNSYISLLPAPDVRVTVVSVSGLLRNLGKAVAPGIVGPLVLALGYRLSFAAVGVLAMAAPVYLAPLLREKRDSPLEVRQTAPDNVVLAADRANPLSAGERRG